MNIKIYVLITYILFILSVNVFSVKLASCYFALDKFLLLNLSTYFLSLSVHQGIIIRQLSCLASNPTLSYFPHITDIIIETKLIK